MNKQYYQKLSGYIQRKQLTSCLELLERYGYTGDVAIFVLSYIQAAVGGAK